MTLMIRCDTLMQLSGGCTRSKRMISFAFISFYLEREEFSRIDEFFMNSVRVATNN
jgi:hypothetical protein